MKFVKYIFGFVLITYCGLAQKVITADSLMAKVTQLYYAGNYGKAIELCKKVESFYRFKNDFNHIAALQVDISTLYYTQGNVELALQTLKNGVEYWKKQNNPNSDTTLFRLYSAMGLMHNIAFRYDSSAFYYEKGEVLMKKSPKRILALDGAYSFFVNQGTIQAEFRDFEKSNDYFLKAKLLPKSATRTNDEVVLNGLGNNFLEANKPKEAIGYYEKAFNESINPYNKAKYAYNESRAFNKLGQINEFEKYIGKASQLYKEVTQKYKGWRDIYLEQNIIQSTGDLLFQKNQLEKAKQKFQEVLILQKETGKAKGYNAFYAYQWLGKVAEKQNNLKQALANFQQAIIAVHWNFKETDIYKNPELTNTISDISLFDALHAKAKAFAFYYAQTHKIKDLQMALATFRLAIQLAEKTRISYESAGSKMYFTEKNYPIYGQALETAYTLWSITKKAEYQAIAFDIIEKSRSAILADALKNMEIKPQTIPADLLIKEKMFNRALTGWRISVVNEKDSLKNISLKNKIIDNELELSRLRQSYEKVSPQYFQLKYQSQSLTLAQAQQQLIDAKTAVISYFLTENALFTILITPEGTQLLRQELDTTFLQDVNNLRQHLYKNPGMSVYNHEPAVRCYARLILPLERWLANKTRLIIFRDAELNFIPFEILESGQMAKDFLVKRFAISYGYSVNLLAKSLETGQEGSKHLMAMAPYTNQAAVRSLFRDKSLKSLPATEAEVRQIGGEIYLERQATKRRFLETYQKSGVIHFATHAVTDDEDPTKSFIAFYPDSTQFKLYTNELYDLSLQNTRLVVLSACETGSGAFHKGEGVMSLARAFMYAGCPSVVTTLWNAHDESSAYLSERLHQYLQQKMPIDEALQKAKLDYFSSNLGKEYDHPYFWANFTLIGNREPVDEKTTFMTWWMWLGLGIIIIGSGYWWWKK